MSPVDATISRIPPDLRVPTVGSPFARVTSNAAVLKKDERAGRFLGKTDDLLPDGVFEPPRPMEQACGERLS
jgi:hypothetical protein